MASRISPAQFFAAMSLIGMTGGVNAQDAVDTGHSAVIAQDGLDMGSAADTDESVATSIDENVVSYFDKNQAKWTTFLDAVASEDLATAVRVGEAADLSADEVQMLMSAGTEALQQEMLSW